METKDIITLVIALYAAGVATIALVWNITSWQRDRGELKLTGEVSSDLGGAGGSMREFYAPHITISHSGKESLSMAKWNTMYKDGTSFGNTFDPHMELGPGNKTYKIKGRPCCEKHNAMTEARDLDKVYVLDAGGKKWKMKQKELRKFKSQAVKYLREKEREDVSE